MKIETVTYEVQIKVFDVGERVRPTSSRCPLEPGEYVVRSYARPHFPGEDPVIFVYGRDQGLSTEYVDLTHDGYSHDS